MIKGTKLHAAVSFLHDKLLLSGLGNHSLQGT